MAKERSSVLLSAGLVLCVMAAEAAGDSTEIRLANAVWEIRLSPATLAMTATPAGKDAIELSAGQTGLGPATNLTETTVEADWRLQAARVSVRVRLEGRDLHVRIQSDREGSFTWPVQRLEQFKALIWPRAEGVYVPLDDRCWTDYLIEQGEWSTLEGISMPFWGFDCRDFVLTCIATCPYNNAIRFERDKGGLRSCFVHEFTRFQQPKEYGFVFSLGEGASPVEPARRFRRWLIEDKAFVTMKAKMEKAPRAQRLLGAAHAYLWGDGVSIEMLETFRKAGFDRLRLCVSGWEDIEKRPLVATRADEMGYLLGTYDSYHSIHDPAIQGTDQTWPTAQFDRQLYERGKILRRDGVPRGGFKGVGAKLSPIAARPYVEKRVFENMARVPYSYYFVDCDAYGEVYDDYSPRHPCGQADDVAARVDRLRWISETFRVPIGSEGGCFCFAGVIHVSEGIFGPLFGWDDPDMRNRESQYYTGGYYPPDGPRIFVRQVPVKGEYEYFYYDPRFRLPLYEMVFHDSIVTTHHWQSASLKFTNVAETVALTELLYMAPPLYHMNLNEFEKHRAIVKRHYDCFSPLHRELGFAQMTGFDWLSVDRLLQRTTFDERVEIVANFSPDVRQYGNADVPGRSVLVRWKDSGRTILLARVPGEMEAKTQ